MKKKINTRLIIITVMAVIVTTVAVTVVYYNLLQSRVQKGLRIQADIIEAADISDLAAGNQMAGNKDIRITWIGADGSVLYDNDTDASTMENHADRPEFQAALKNGTGEIVRESGTMNMRTFYFAALLNDGTVLRVANEARSIFSVFISVIPVILLAIALIIIVCIVLSNLLTRQLISPINKMVEDLDTIPAEAVYKELNPFVETIRKQHEDVLTAVKSRQDFTANVSHELKTPITAISGYAELIETGIANEEQTVHFAGEIRKNSERLVTLVNDIIYLSELDHKDISEKFSEVDLYETAKERIELLRNNAREKAILLSLNGEKRNVMSTKNYMVELVDNLVQNAIRYNIEGGKVAVFVGEENNRTVLIVEDTGIGIPEADQKHVFERFYRVDKGRSRATGGTGLGLAIVKHIVEIHEGEIQLTSEMGKGTRIKITL